MQYRIFLEDLLLEVVIGILPFEREKKQKICVNAEFVYSKFEGEEFLDYRDLRGFINESFAREFGLLEEALEYLASEIPKHFPKIQSYTIKITKLEIFGDCKASVQISQNLLQSQKT